MMDMSLIRQCKKCGKRGLLLSLDQDGLCGDCVIARRQAEEDAKKVQEAQELSDAQGYYDSLVGLLHTIFIDPYTCSLEDLRRAASECDHFISELKRMPSVPQFSKVFIDHCSYIGAVSAINNDFGQILISDGGTADFGEFIGKAEKSREIVLKMLENWDNFNSTLKVIPLAKVDIDTYAPPHTNALTNGLTIKTSNITQKTSLTKLNTFVVTDVETTGLNPLKDEIIQVTAIKFLGWQPIEMFFTYVKPRYGLNPKSQAINGITEDDVADAPYIESIMKSFEQFIGQDIPIVGHNISFDYNFLAVNGCTSLLLSRKLYDTLDLSKREYSLFPKYNLDYLCRRALNLYRDSTHDSRSDALATGLLFKDICDRRIAK